MKAYSSDFTQETYSRPNFVHLLSHRVRKDWRINKVFDKQKKYALVDDGKLTTNLLKKLIGDVFAGHFNLQLLKSTETAPSDYCLICSNCLDTYLAQRLNVFLEKKDFDVFTELSPLRTLTKKECEQLADIWQIIGEAIPEEDELIKHLHEKYDQTKQSMLKSFLALEETVKSSE